MFCISNVVHMKYSDASVMRGMWLSMLAIGGYYVNFDCLVLDGILILYHDVLRISRSNLY